MLAGGQSLMPMLNMRLASPSVLIDINPVTELAGISVAEGVLHIGAMTRHREVAESPLVREHLPLIALAMRHVAHPAIQNRGTFGGSLATADPSAEMPACCLALDARILLESRRGRRSVEAGDFFRGIFRDRARAGRTAGRRGHLDTGCRMAAELHGVRQASRRLRHRRHRRAGEAGCGAHLGHAHRAVRRRVAAQPRPGCRSGDACRQCRRHYRPRRSR